MNVVQAITVIYQNFTYLFGKPAIRLRAVYSYNTPLSILANCIAVILFNALFKGLNQRPMPGLHSFKNVGPITIVVHRGLLKAKACCALRQQG